MSDQALENFKTGEHTREQPCRNLPISAHSSASETVETDLAEAQLHHITMRMKGSAKDLIWELSRLFPDKSPHSVANHVCLLTGQKQE